MTLILTIEIHVLQKRAYLTYSAIKVVYTFQCRQCRLPLLLSMLDTPASEVHVFLSLILMVLFIFRARLL